MPTQIFHLSDVHFGVENRDALARFAAAVASEQPDAIICTGDLTQRAKHSEYSDAATYFAQFDVPVILCAGNHDMPYGNLFERFTDPYRRYRRLLQAVGGALNSDDVVLIPFKTTVRIQPRFPWSDGYVMQDALTQTTRHLKGLQGDPRIKLIYCHHPLLPARDDGRNPTIGGDEAFAALAKAGGDAVISGHVHTPFNLRRERDGHPMQMLGAGTLSTRLRGKPPSYEVLRCARGEPVTSELRELD